MANIKQNRKKVVDHEPEAIARNKLMIQLMYTRRKHVPLTHIERVLWATLTALVEEIYDTRRPQAILCTNTELYLSTSRLLRIVESELLNKTPIEQTGERNLAYTIAKSRQKQSNNKP